MHAMCSVNIPRSVGYRTAGESAFYIRLHTNDSPGVIGILAGPAGVREVGWRLRPEGASTEPDETVQMALGQLREYFAGQRRDFTLPLDLPPMEPVTQAVLQALRTVGYGETITYGELAELSGTGVPARAIGEIVAANPALHARLLAVLRH